MSFGRHPVLLTLVVLVGLSVLSFAIGAPISTQSRLSPLSTSTVNRTG